MQRIQLQPDVLDEKARLVQQKKLELDRIVRELEKSIYMLQSEWSGVTGERFFWDFMQVKEVFPTTLGLLDKIQNEFTFIARNFRTTDGSGEVALYIPEELKRNFAVGLLDKSIGETITGLGQTTEAFFDNPFSTLSSVAYAMTVGKVVDVGRGVQFAWDTAWGTGTARSDIEKFVEEQKKQIDESGAGYYGGAMTGQALAYVLFGKAFRSKDDIGSGGSGGGKPVKANVEPSKGSKINSSKEVEIINQRGESLGEFDEIDLNKGIFYEDKSAQGLNKVNPKTGLPAQTPQEFADKQIFTKTSNRIFALENATSTRTTVNGSQEIPTLEDIKGIKEFIFRLDGDTTELRQSVNNSIKKLKNEFPEYKFSAKFGGD
ncbi:WXG100 family type VII secretion target [Paenibacillus sp. LS1]|uniref:WXG100 family type VII secretion target n=1 Tax=Paenibacillus sp. LS1 TaxID=2992120 RepID=UPI0022314B97|nr:WXG100 family type VII secretion target [Paenibacillus sp. LS1]